MSKFIISGFADEIDPYLDKQMDILDPLQIRFIEIRGADGQNVSKLTEDEARVMAKRLAARGYRISAIGSPIGKFKGTDYAAHLDLFKHCIRLAQIFDTQYIRMFSFYNLDQLDAGAFRDQVMRRWEEMLKLAAGTGVTLLHENEKGIFGENAENCLDLAETLGIGLIFDPANFIESGVETYPHAFSLLKKHVQYMHIKDARFSDRQVVPAGYGDGHLKEIFSELDKMGFEGFLSLEPHLSHFQGFAELELEPATRSMEEGGPKAYTTAAESLFKTLREAGITPTFTL